MYASVPGGPVSVQPCGSSTRHAPEHGPPRTPGVRGRGWKRSMSTPLAMAVTCSGSMPSIEIARVPVLRRHGDEVVGEVRLLAAGGPPRTRRGARPPSASCAASRRARRRGQRRVGRSTIARDCGHRRERLAEGGRERDPRLDAIDQLQLGAVEVHDHRHVGPAAGARRRAAASGGGGGARRRGPRPRRAAGRPTRPTGARRASGGTDASTTSGTPARSSYDGCIGSGAAIGSPPASKARTASVKSRKWTSRPSKNVGAYVSSPGCTRASRPRARPTSPPAPAPGSDSARRTPIRPAGRTATPSRLGPDPSAPTLGERVASSECTEPQTRSTGASRRIRRRLWRPSCARDHGARQHHRLIAQHSGAACTGSGSTRPAPRPGRRRARPRGGRPPRCSDSRYSDRRCRRGPRGSRPRRARGSPGAAPVTT